MTIFQNLAVILGLRPLIPSEILARNCDWRPIEIRGVSRGHSGDFGTCAHRSVQLLFVYLLRNSDRAPNPLKYNGDALWLLQRWRWAAVISLRQFACLHGSHAFSCLTLAVEDGHCVIVSWHDDAFVLVQDFEVTLSWRCSHGRWLVRPEPL